MDKKEVGLSDTPLGDFLTTKQVLDLFPGMAIQTPRMAAERGNVLATKVGRFWLFQKDSAIRYFNRQERRGNAKWKKKE